MVKYVYNYSIMQKLMLHIFIYLLVTGFNENNGEHNFNDRQNITV